MPFPMDLSHCLALAPAYEPLAVTRIPEEARPAVCASQGLHEGDRVSRIADRPGHVLVQKADGERLVLDTMQALLIEVDPVGRGAPRTPTAPRG